MKHVPRVFADRALVTGARLTLDDSAGHHLARVLRVRPGDPVVLFNGKGGEMQAETEAVHPRSVTLRLVRHDPVDREAPLEVTLLQGLSRGARMDYTVEKATELGVHRIVPVRMTRSVTKLDEKRSTKRVAHWQRIAIAACQQCGRTRLPQVAEPTALADALTRLPSHAARLLLHPDGNPIDASQVGEHRTAVLAIGPEGGIDVSEKDAMTAAGFVPVCLGPRVLRTETAAIAGLAVLQFLAGGLAGP